MYISLNEHSYVFKTNIFYLKWYLNLELRVIKLLKIRLYNRPRLVDRRRLMLIMKPGCPGTKSPRMKQNFNTVCILTLMVTFHDHRMDQFMICRH